MEKKIIKCVVSEEYIIGAGVVIGAVGSHDETVLRFEFSDIWQGLAKTVFWTNADGSDSTFTELITNGTETYDAPVPAIAKTAAGMAKVTVRGVMIEDEKECIVAVAEAEFEVLPSSVPENYREQLDISPTAAEQILGGIEELKYNIAEGVEAAANAKKSEDAAALSATLSSKAAVESKDASDLAKSYTMHPPKPINEYWHLWDGTKYVASDEPARGEPGPSGAAGVGIIGVKLIREE